MECRSILGNRVTPEIRCSALSSRIGYDEEQPHEEGGERAKPPEVHRRQLRILEQEPIGQPQAFP